MELIKALPRRARPSEVLYYVINGILPIAVLLLVLFFDPPYLAVALIVLSKWRVFALQPRFWWANIRANLVDILVGLGIVGLLYLAASSLPIQIFITIGYGVWLLYLKPRSNTSSIAAQAAVAQFVALTALLGFSNVIPEVLFVFAVWVIAYTTARHFISNFNEQFIELMTVAWAFVIAQLGWLAYRWTLAYEITDSLIIPQISILMLVISFTSARLYMTLRRDDEERKSGDVRSTVLFGAILVVFILLFSKWNVVIY